MRVTRAIAVACVCCILLGGCAASGARGADGARVADTYVVRPHDTLYGIAWRHDLDYRDLARWNGIGPDYRLSVGQVLMLNGTRAANAPRTKPPAAPNPVAGGAGLQWAWPTEHTVAPRAVPGGGILLFGKLGQDVRAAGGGRVVYTGNGIRGFGNLIIIKHGDILLTSYAHNQEILVKEGQDVSLGQLIAHMGAGPHQVAVLYFEIRANGKPVDPLPYLPSR